MSSPEAAIILTSLAAEGTPRMALSLCRSWQAAGHRVVVGVLQARPDDLSAEFDALGVERVALGFGERGLWRYALLLVRVFSLVRRTRARAVLSMPLGWHAVIALGARLAGAQRVVAHVGNHPAATPNRAFRKFRRLVRLGRPFTHRLACCSRYVRDGAVAAFGVTEAETAVIYNGAPLDTVAARAASARDGRAPDAPFTIGMVATLQRHKDQPTLIRAVSELSAKGLAVRLWLVGEGARRDEYRALIAELGLEAQVTLLGMRRDVPELLGQLDVFAFSTTPDEGLGIALIEAMAAGVPIVATDAPACREVLDDGALGLLTAPGDPAALARAITAVREDPAGAAERARRARDKAFAVFSETAMAEGYAALLGIDAG